MLANLYLRLRALLNREEGQGMVEYALILVLIAVVVIVVLIILVGKSVAAFGIVLAFRHGVHTALTRGLSWPSESKAWNWSQRTP